VPAVGGGAGRRVRVLKDRSGSLGSSIIASKGGGNSVLRRPARGECVASLRVILYDLKVPRTQPPPLGPIFPILFTANRKQIACHFSFLEGHCRGFNGIKSIELTPGAPSGGSTSDADLQYGCVLSVGNKAILPSNVFVPLSTQPTCLGSHINLCVIHRPPVGLHVIGD
jgi:hypothetical protein